MYKRLENTYCSMVLHYTDLPLTVSSKLVHRYLASPHSNPILFYFSSDQSVTSFILIPIQDDLLERKLKLFKK